MPPFKQQLALRSPKRAEPFAFWLVHRSVPQLNASSIKPFYRLVLLTHPKVFGANTLALSFSVLKFIVSILCFFRPASLAMHQVNSFPSALSRNKLRVAGSPGKERMVAAIELGTSQLLSNSADTRFSKTKKTFCVLTLEFLSPR